jgi:hypothetical protein
MPHPNRLPCCLLAAALVLGACRPADAPKEPTEPTEPTVSRDATPAGGGVGIAFARRGQAVARL